MLHTDSIYCLKGYNAMFEPAPFRHGIAHSPAVTAATAPAARRTAAPAPDVEKGLRSSPGAAKDAGPAATATARDADGAHSTAAAAQSYAAKRVRGARDNWAPEWSAPVPRSYCFSPSLVPRPADWPAHVNAVGFCRDPNAGDDSNYVPPPELEAFLAQGPKPVYIGFGSMTIDDPEVRATPTLTNFPTLTSDGDTRHPHIGSPDPRSKPASSYDHLCECMREWK